MNKSILTNSLALVVTLVGYMADNNLLFTAGLFALSGALTNWLAVHMLFEKVPLLYGSGVIPARFDDFKAGIRDLMMRQFFTADNIDKFLSDQQGNAVHLDFNPIIQQVDLTPAFDGLIEVIESSSFGGMLAMVGGRDVLLPLKDDFIGKMRQTMTDVTQSDEFAELVRNELERPATVSNMQDKVAEIIEKRLAELTPSLVKQIVQDMIQQHLGWLVVWGGVFGGAIGLLAAISGSL